MRLIKTKSIGREFRARESSMQTERHMGLHVAGRSYLKVNELNSIICDYYYYLWYCDRRIYKLMLQRENYP